MSTEDAVTGQDRLAEIDTEGERKDWRSEPERRLIDRRCRCGRLAAETADGCAWHPSVSAEYARDLLSLVETQRKQIEAAAELVKDWSPMLDHPLAVALAAALSDRSAGAAVTGDVTLPDQAPDLSLDPERGERL